MYKVMETKKRLLSISVVAIALLASGGVSAGSTNGPANMDSDPNVSPGASTNAGANIDNNPNVSPGAGSTPSAKAPSNIDNNPNVSPGASTNPSGGPYNAANPGGAVHQP